MVEVIILQVIGVEKSIIEVVIQWNFLEIGSKVYIFPKPILNEYLNNDFFY
jgi:hypothetical protein